MDQSVGRNRVSDMQVLCLSRRFMQSRVNLVMHNSDVGKRLRSSKVFGIFNISRTKFPQVSFRITVNYIKHCACKLLIRVNYFMKSV